MNDDNPIFRSLAIIEERIQEKLTVENLAGCIHLSKYHYQRMFRETVGDSVMRYVTRRRLSMAAEELAGKDVSGKDTSILAIALKYGYDSHEGFTRSFRAYMGVTPTEYRRYHLSIASPIVPKERCAMLYSSVTDEMLRELNGLIVRIKETVTYTRKCRETVPEDAAVYRQFWDFIADMTDAMTAELTQTLKRITVIAQRPDEISARFMIIKAIEDTAFWSDITVFQAGLMISRAKPEHRRMFEPICDKYEQLSQEVRMKSGKLLEFFNELSALIFRDMRENAQGRILKAVEAGRAAAAEISAGGERAREYVYIAEEVKTIADTLSAMPLEEITTSLLEDDIFRLEVIAFAADVDALRAPGTRQLLEGIAKFRKQLCEAVEFFQSLSGDMAQALAGPQENPVPERTADKAYRDLAFEGNILLFYLKGELQKLGRRFLREEQITEFDAICNHMNEAIECANYVKTAADKDKIRENLQAAYDGIMAEAESLGEYGEPLRYIAKEIKQLIR